jgi:hypothetical protein
VSGQELDEAVGRMPGLVLVRPRWSEAGADRMREMVGDEFVNGVQGIFRFDNSWGASVITGFGAHGVELMLTIWRPDAQNLEEGAWMLAQDLKAPHFQSMIPDDLRYGDVGWLDAAGLLEVLKRIAELPDLRQFLRPETKDLSALQQVLEWLTPKITLYPKAVDPS